VIVIGYDDGVVIRLCVFLVDEFMNL